MTTYRRGQVVVVNVPFSTQEGAKPRPAVVVSAETFHRALPESVGIMNGVWRGGGPGGGAETVT